MEKLKDMKFVGVHCEEKYGVCRAWWGTTFETKDKKHQQKTIGIEAKILFTDLKSETKHPEPLLSHILKNSTIDIQENGMLCLKEGDKEIREGDEVIVKTHDSRINNRVGIVKAIENLSAKSEKHALTEYFVVFKDHGIITDGEFTREELRKIIW